MIRRARAEDFVAVERMLAAMERHAAIAVDGPGEEYASDHFRAVFDRLLVNRSALALILEAGGEPRGVLLAIASASPFRQALWADELLFWIDPPARGRWAGRFLDRYEAWAAALGARVAGLSCFDARTAALYRRRGYAPADCKYLRVI